MLQILAVLQFNIGQSPGIQVPSFVFVFCQIGKFTLPPFVASMLGGKMIVPDCEENSPSSFFGSSGTHIEGVPICACSPPTPSGFIRIGRESALQLR